MFTKGPSPDIGGDVLHRNYRTWILAICYGLSFGVELTVDNNLANYFETQFDKSFIAAGNLAAIFGWGSLYQMTPPAPPGTQIAPYVAMHTNHLHSHAAMRAGEYARMRACTCPAAICT